MKITALLKGLLSCLLTLLLPSLAFAAPEDATKVINVVDTGHTAWIMACCALVLFMTLPGLALFYGGLVRKKNVLSVLMQCFVIAGVMTIIWVIFGYSLAFGEGNAFIGDFSAIMLNGITSGSIGENGLPDILFVMFQLTFFIITPALIVGGFAERMKFSAMLLFSILWGILVYLPIVHWVWADKGWLLNMGLIDLAGGTVVHITAGVAAVVAAVMLGRRKGFPEQAMPPHNMTLTVAGAGMLWVGWFGFNGGSDLGAGGDGAMAIMVTHISAAAGTLSWILWEKIKFGKPSALGAVTGMVAGLGTITAASGELGPGGALILGTMAGTVCFFATLFIKKTLKIDDSLDVMPVHGVGGILGTFMVAILGSQTLGPYIGGEGSFNIGEQLVIQLVGIGATIGYTAVVTIIILTAVKLLVGLRVDEEQEQRGLDLSQHEERGYDI